MCMWYLVHFCHFQVPKDQPCWVIVGNQAVTQGENKLPHEYYTSESQYFYRFRAPYKITTKGADQRCPPTPLTTPMGRAE